jgi:DNA-binding HxlR family transcriptional regulator
MPNTTALTRELSLKVVAALRHGARRFCQIETTTGVKNPVHLSRVLKKLVRDGLVTRHAITLGPPARVEYALTEIGVDLVDPAVAMVGWIDRYRGKITDTRRDSNAATAAKRAQALLTDHAVAPQA